jgi:NAD(P)-dependent dehydrogenase (short-subunit alcohol dehydrogenase family)
MALHRSEINCYVAELMGENITTDLFGVAGLRCVVVGGTAGIGLAVAQHLAACGAEVTITGRRAADDLASTFGGHAIAMDVADSTSVAAGFVSIEPGIDCLILNAGIDAETGLIDDHDLATFERVIDVNTLGLARAMHHGVQRMNDGGSVIITSSPAGSVAVPGMAAYSASKAALDMLVKSWALDLGPRQIRVNGVLPGIVESEMDSESSPSVELIRRMTANGRYRQAADMAPVFQFLASPASVTLTGSSVGAHDGIPLGFSAEAIGHLGADLEGDS